MSTTNYQAGAESDFVQLSYGVEAQWATKPAIAFKRIRLTGESLKPSQTRSRPPELNTTGQVTAATTTMRGAGGGINFALSYGTFDDFLASVMGSAWDGANHLVASNVFTSLYLQKMLATGLFLEYPGCLVTDASLSFQQGQFSSGSFTVAGQQEISSTQDASTGATLAAPGGRVVDTLGGIQAITWNGAAPTTKVKNLQLRLQRQGASADYALGSVAAIGMKLGLLEVTGSLDVYFKDFGLYTDFVNEAQRALAFTVADPAGNAYAITLPQAVLTSPSITAGGQNQSVMASFTIEGNPDSTGGNTMQIVRTPAAN